MKYCAYYVQDNKRINVTIYQILCGEVSVEGKILYSYNSGNPRVFFVRPSVNRRAHFRFENGYQGEGGGGESITHSTYKDVIASADKLTLCFFNGNHKEKVVLYGVQSQTEYRIIANCKSYIADICVDFERSDPAYFGENCRNRVLIEVTHKHATDNEKYVNLKKAGYAVFEYAVDSRYELREDDEQWNERRCTCLKKFIADGLNVTCHHLPKSISQYIAEIEMLMLDIERKTREIDKISKEKEILEEENNELKNENMSLIVTKARTTDELRNMNNRMAQFRQGSEYLQARIEESQNENQRLRQQLQEMQLANIELENEVQERNRQIIEMNNRGLIKRILNRN